ncbi:MAG: LysM peptidoglycan-binding domain-containing protein [Saprospiraceae bacterium]|nr:LysM peptidoglycan-binding domain-containing protein [Saprospiraceae bacterium]
MNDGRTKLYIVRETSTQYHVASVDKAAMLATKGGTMEFATDDVAFSLYLNNPLSGVNLALPGSKLEVYLDGTINYQCLKGYILQKKASKDSRSFKEYVIVPELGIVERASVAKSGFIDEILRDNEFKLAKVDDVLFKSILSDVCDHYQATYYDGVTSTQPTSYDYIASKGGVPTSYGGGDPCAPTTEPGVHVVQKGETLYGLSKRYGVQVAQIQGWNNLDNSNIISLCQRLWVKEPSGKTTTSTGSQTTEKGGSTTTSSTGYWTQSAGEHQVRSGETVASLARMYGYTEERFRKMNGLSLTETLLPGQRLRTNDCNCPTLETSTKDTPLPYDQPTETLVAKEGTAATTKPINNQDVYYRPISVHVVKDTDTLYSIAKQYNTTVERILELNGMTKNDKLTNEQRIYVQ